ncbi:hypothetical protein PR003_g12236 [Phytophthora rubi]|uniref:Uncharacterized protein n=1 Tax=Phytophthora rubi TaxID=129364 RepID=A0A6A4F5Q1_9STRA|nr:hypothetical protein PR003_g12236 [Phytophthora rubi]
MERPSKRLRDDAPKPAKRPETGYNAASTPPPTNPLTAAPSAMEIRAFGLEDRAEAVISRGRQSWTLANLSKWRQDSLDAACNSTESPEPHSKLSSKEYLRRRQRTYRQQCLNRHTETNVTTQHPNT